MVFPRLSLRKNKKKVSPSTGLPALVDKNTQETTLCNAEIAIGNTAVASLFNDIEQHEQHTSSSFDLIASNSCCSPQVRKIMGSSLVNSYCIGLPGDRFFGGCTEIDTIERKTRQLLCKLFGAKYCEVQLLSGMLANVAAYHAMLPGPGCTVMASPSKNGGHYSHNAGGPLTRLFGATVVATPWDEKRYNVDVNRLALAMKVYKPTLLILGWSEMLFEYDLSLIRRICDFHHCKLMYDMSHIAGLIAGGAFQQDMMKYADIVTSSTGKSLHSADHGLILYNDARLTPKIREAVMPLLTSNTHFQETAALYMALLEMQAFGREYASQVVANTQALAKELVDQHNFKLLCPELGYSMTHELILDLQGESGAEATRQLDAAGIFTNPQELPTDTEETGATGLRLGSQVLTRRGFVEKDMAEVADAISNVLQKGKDPTVVAQEVATKCSKVSGVRYTFGGEERGEVLVWV